MLPGGDIVYSQGIQPLVGSVLADLLDVANNPVFFYSTYNPSTGFEPVYNFYAENPNCGNTTPGNIVQFANSSGTAILSVPCADTGGNGVTVNAQLTETGGLIRNENTMASSAYALCGGYTLKDVQCFPSAPFPLATSTPVAAVNFTGGISTTQAAFELQESNGNCSGLGSLSADSIFSIYGSTTSGSGLFYITCSGNAALTGAFTSNSVVLEGLSSISYSALCAGSSGVPTVSQCFTGLPVPQATSAPIPSTNSTTVATSPAWSYRETNSNCTVAGTLASFNFIEFLNSAGQVFGVNCMGNAILSGTLTVTELIDSGLSSASVVPLCAGNASSQIQCNNSVAAKCNVVNPTTGQLIVCGTVTNGSLSCTALSVCTVGTFSLGAGWANTSYTCSGNQEGSGTTYANRALVVGFGAPASASIVVNVAAPQTISSQSVSVFVSCTE